jgi:hypothetical protein
VGYAFFCLNLFAIFATIFSGYSKDWYGMSMNFILIISSLIAAISSYCHEGLSNEVSVFARQNDEFASLNETLGNQLKDMENVKVKYQHVLDDLQGDETLLKDLVASLHRIVLMKNLQTIFRAFMDADENKDQHIGPKEADMFFSNTWAVLRYAAGDLDRVARDSDSAYANSARGAFPLQQLYEEAMNAEGGKNCSLDRDDVKLLIYACSLSGDIDKPHASKALLWLVLFCFNPDVYADGFAESLIVALLGTSPMEKDEENMRSLVQTIKRNHAGAFKYSQDEDCKKLVDSILHGSSSTDKAVGTSHRVTPSPTPRVRR